MDSEAKRRELAVGLKYSDKYSRSNVRGLRESRVRAALRGVEKPLFEGDGPKRYEDKVRSDTQASGAFAKGDRVVVYGSAGTVERVDRQVWIKFDAKRGRTVPCNPHVVVRA